MHKWEVLILENTAEIVARIKTMAASKGMKLYYISDMLGVGPSYFSDCARGKNTISASRLETIADLLDTTVAWLKGESTDAKRPLEDISVKGLTEREQIALELFGHLTFAEQDAQIALWKSREKSEQERFRASLDLLESIK